MSKEGNFKWYIFVQFVQAIFSILGVYLFRLMAISFVGKTAGDILANSLSLILFIVCVVSCVAFYPRKTAKRRPQINFKQ